MPPELDGVEASTNAVFDFSDRPMSYIQDRGQLNVPSVGILSFQTFTILKEKYFRHANYRPQAYALPLPWVQHPCPIFRLPPARRARSQCPRFGRSVPRVHSGSMGHARITSTSRGGSAWSFTVGADERLPWAWFVEQNWSTEAPPVRIDVRLMNVLIISRGPRRRVSSCDLTAQCADMGRGQEFSVLAGWC